MSQDPSAPSASLALPARTTPPPPSATATTTTTTRRVPPPCWTHEETVALIDAYYEKWHSLRRGNLKATHWQEVADAVARRCRFATPSKTSVQCRHKIEKLRKRYRTEKQRALALAAPNRFVSSWVFFRKMDAMEKGPSLNVDSDENEEDDEDDDGDEDEDEDDDGDRGANENNASSRSLNHLMSNGRGGSGDGFRLRIPGGQRSVPCVGSAKSKSFIRVNENPNPNPNPNSNASARVWNSCSWSRSGFGRSGDGGGASGGSKRDMDPVAEMVSSIRLLGEGFVKMEQMKIDMAREMEQMRMEMEMKRTEMILESQQRIVEAFAKGFSAKKKPKRMPSPDS